MLSLPKHLYRIAQRNPLPLLATGCVVCGLSSCVRQITDAAFEQALTEASLKSGRYRVNGDGFYAKGRIVNGKRKGAWTSYNSYGEPTRIIEYTKNSPRVKATFNPKHR